MDTFQVTSADTIELGESHLQVDWPNFKLQYSENWYITVYLLYLLGVTEVTEDIYNAFYFNNTVLLAISTGKLPIMRKIGDHLITGKKSFYKSNNCYMSLQLVGNKAKERISKRVFQENKARQIFRKTNISYPLISARTCAYQGLRKVRFSENLAYFVFLKHPFWGSPFWLITDKQLKKP